MNLDPPAGSEALEMNLRCFRLRGMDQMGCCKTGCPDFSILFVHKSEKGSFGQDRHGKD